MGGFSLFFSLAWARSFRRRGVLQDFRRMPNLRWWKTRRGDTKTQNGGAQSVFEDAGQYYERGERYELGGKNSGGIIGRPVY